MLPAFLKECRILAQVRAELNTAATCTLNIIGSQAITLKVDTLVQEQGEFEFQVSVIFYNFEIARSRFVIIQKNLRKACHITLKSTKSYLMLMALITLKKLLLCLGWTQQLLASTSASLLLQIMLA